MAPRRSHLPPLFRKVQTAFTTLRRCENGPAILAAKLHLRPDIHEVRLKNGLRLEADQGILRAWGEIYEPAVADAYGIRNFAADLIVDVGANIGAFSCSAAHAHPTATLYAFEPNPAAARQARVNFARNRLEHIHLIESPVTGDGRDVVLHLNASRGSASLVLSEGENVPMPSVTLDQVPFEKSRAAFLKLDCEGTEAEIIPWLAARQHRLPPVVLIVGEHHPWCPRPLDELLEILAQAGFQTESLPQYGSLYFRAWRGSF